MAAAAALAEALTEKAPEALRRQSSEPPTALPQRGGQAPALRLHQLLASEPPQPRALLPDTHSS